jgi:hypothetical protein
MNIIKENLGEQHDLYASILNNLSITLEKLEDY